MKLISRAISILLAVLFMVPSANAVVKTGASCTKVGAKSVSGGKTYTCVKSGKKLVWDKGIVVTKPSAADPSPSPAPSTEPTPVPTKSATPEVVKIDYSQTFSTDQGYLTEFTGPCQFDNNVTGQLAEIQTYFYNYNRCGGQLRVNKYELGKARPTESFEPVSNFSNVEPCKLITPTGVRSNLGYTTTEPGRNQWANERRYPSPNTVIQLVPIYSDDTEEPKNSPNEDYQAFLGLLKDWIEYSSDFGSNVEVRVPSQYIKFGQKIGEFGLLHTQNWDTPNHVSFNKAVVAAVDGAIDFKGVNIAIVVPPAGTKASVMGQASIGSLVTSEGKVGVAITQYAYKAANPNSSTYSNLGHPFWWIHELMHAGYGFDDHYGDTKNNLNSEYGMGWLTMMTPFGGDFTTWEKWILGFMRDSQIQCVDGKTSSTHWIAPSTVQTTASKAIVIKISSTKVVVVETLRPGGLYYKLPKQSQGALVYEIDLLQDSHGMGMKLSLPLGRNVYSDPFFMASYPLKKGDATISNGYKITIVESGTYGDVVKVEKVA